MRLAAGVLHQRMQLAAKRTMQQHAPHAELGQWRTTRQQTCRFQRSGQAAQHTATAPRLTALSSCKPPLGSRNSNTCRLNSQRHSDASAVIGSIDSIGGRQQREQLGSIGGRRPRRQRRCRTVAKARPPRMRGQACDLRERPRSTALPAVDWRRYHLNVLFVDRSDTVRARVAAGLFERVSEWNGWGRILLTATAGVEAEPDSPPDMSTNMALFSQAGLLGIRPKLFAAAPERFEADDFYRYDAIVALDEDVRRRIVEMGVAENPQESNWYTRRVCSLGAFSYYCGDELLAHGGSALLEKELVRILLPVLPAARQRSEIPRPDLAKGPEEWNPMVAAVLVAVAGLFKYLADEYPPDLPDYDPV